MPQAQAAPADPGLKRPGDLALGLGLITVGALAGYITLRGRWPIVLLALLYPWDVVRA